MAEVKATGWVAVEEKLFALYHEGIMLGMHGVGLDPKGTPVVINGESKVKTLWKLVHGELGKQGGPSGLIRARKDAWKANLGFWNWLMCQRVNRMAFLQMGVESPPLPKEERVKPGEIAPRVPGKSEGLPSPSRENLLGTPNPLPKGLDPRQFSFPPSQGLDGRVDALRRTLKEKKLANADEILLGKKPQTTKK